MSVLRLVTDEAAPDTVSAGSYSLHPEGTVIAERYEIRRLIGVGSFSDVYLAYDHELNTNVALKMLRGGRMSNVAMARLRREINIARDVASNHVVSIWDVGSVGQATYLAMEYLEGGSLRDWLRKGSLTLDEITSISLQVAEGLRALHAAGAVHRDIKPENILLTATGEAKIADLGMARYAEPALSGTSPGTSPGVIIGTAAYLSPEQATGRPADARADLFSWGAVMFEMLTGQPPFVADSAIEMLAARLHSKAPDVRDVRRDVPRWLSQIVARLLATDPVRRLQSASELREALLAESSALTPEWLPALRRSLMESSSSTFCSIAAVAFAITLLDAPLTFTMGLGVLVALVLSAVTVRALVRRAFQLRDNPTLAAAYAVAASLLATEVMIVISVARRVTWVIR
jgi:serine/threonine protein kinase